MNSPESAEIHAARVSFNFLNTSDVVPALGRGFTVPEELPNGPTAVLLVNRFWRDRFHVFPMDVKVDLVTTLPVSALASHHDRSMSTRALFGKLKPGVTISEASLPAQSHRDRSHALLTTE